MPTSIVQVPTRDGSGNWQFRVTEDGPIITDFDKANFARQILEALYLRSSGPGYKSYVALMDQQGTNAPTVLHQMRNDLGAIVWTRSGVGDYIGTLAGAFVSEAKTVVFCQSLDYNNAKFVFGYFVDANRVEYVTNNIGGLPGDTSQIYLEIRVYP